MLAEERIELVERDELHAIVEVDVARAGDDEESLRFTCQPERLFTEFARVRGVTRDEQQRTRRDRLYVRERVEINELHVARERRMGRKFPRASLGGELAAGRAIEFKNSR